MRPRLSYANVTATGALFLALGGTGYAASTLPRNSVGANQIRRGAVTTSEVRDGSLLAGDFQPGQLPQGARGERGPQGVPGAAGSRGPQGPAGPGRVVRIPTLDLANNTGGTLVDVPGVGALEARGCADGNIVLHYVNHSSASQQWVLAGGYHARFNIPADTGSVPAGAAIDNVHNAPADVLTLSVSGERPAAFEVSQSRTPAGHCVLWGEVVAG